MLSMIKFPPITTPPTLVFVSLRTIQQCMEIPEVRELFFSADVFQLQPVANFFVDGSSFGRFATPSELEIAMFGFDNRFYQDSLRKMYQLPDYPSGTGFFFLTTDAALVREWSTLPPPSGVVSTASAQDEAMACSSWDEVCFYRSSSLASAFRTVLRNPVVPVENKRAWLHELDSLGLRQSRPIQFTFLPKGRVDRWVQEVGWNNTGMTKKIPIEGPVGETVRIAVRHIRCSVVPGVGNYHPRRVNFTFEPFTKRFQQLTEWYECSTFNLSWLVGIEGLPSDAKVELWFHQYVHMI